MIRLDDTGRTERSQVRAYSEARATAECLRVRLRGACDSLSGLMACLENGGNMNDCEERLQKAARTMPDVRRDLNDLMHALQDRKRLEASLRSMGLGGMVG